MGIKQLKSARWQADFRRAGAPYLCATFDYRADAEYWLAETCRSHKAGTLVQQVIKSQKPTVKAVFVTYRDDISEKRRGKKQEKSRINGFLNPDHPAYCAFVERTVGTKTIDTQIDDVTAEDLDAFRVRRLQLAGSDTVRREMVLLSAIFTQCCLGKKNKGGWKHIDINPMRSVVLPESGNRRDRRILTVDWPLPDDESGSGKTLQLSELDAISIFANSVNLDFFIMISVCLGTRRGEQTLVRKSGVIFRGDAISVQLKEGTTKSSKPRLVTLPPNGKRIITTLIERCEHKKDEDDYLLFPMRPDSYTQAFIRARSRARVAYEKACLDAGVEPSPNFLIDLHLHDLRHEAISLFLEKYKLSVADTAKQVGHKDTKILLEYYHPEAEEVNEDMERATKQSWAVVVMESDDGVRLFLPDFPRRSMNLTKDDDVLMVAQGLLKMQEKLFVTPMPIAEVRKLYPDAQVTAIPG